MARARCGSRGWILTNSGPTPSVAPYAVAVIGVGAARSLWCLSLFAAVGRGPPGPWAAPRRVVAGGPYCWVRNPVYLAALTVVSGEAWLWMSLPRLAYAGAMAITVWSGRSWPSPPDSVAGRG